MKQRLPLLLAALLCAGALTACRQQPTPDTDTTDTTVSDTAAPAPIRDPAVFGLSREDFVAVDTHVSYGHYGSTAVGEDMTPPVSYAVDADECPILYITAWEEYVKLPPVLEETDCYWRRCSAALSSDSSGIFAVSERGVTDSLTVTRFQRDGTCSQTTVTFPTEYGVTGLFCNFISDTDGFLFVERVYYENPTLMGAQGTHALMLYKTIDGGASFEAVNLEAPLCVSYTESPLFAKFLDESVGVVSGRYWVTDSLSARTWLTLDGGKTWEPFPVLPHPSDRIDRFTELMELTYEDGSYKATVRVVFDGGGESRRETVYTYRSPELREWTLETPGFTSYDAVIALFEKVAANAVSYNEYKDAHGVYDAMFTFRNERETDWYQQLFASAIALRPRGFEADFGYALSDVDKDGVEELILLLQKTDASDGETPDREIIAILTMADGEPILLDSFRERYRARIHEDGSIRTAGSSSAAENVIRVMEIREGALVPMAEIGTEGVDEQQNLLCYKLVDGEKVSISKEEFDALSASAPFSLPEAALAFQPITLTLPDPVEERFEVAMLINPIDAWYREELEMGITPVEEVYAQYMLLWREEFADTVDAMRALYPDSETYAAWKAGEEAWLEALLAECRAAQGEVMGTLPRAEIGFTYAEKVKARVLELKHRLYTAEVADGKIEHGEFASFVFRMDKENRAIRALFEEVLASKRLVVKDGERVALADCRTYDGHVGAYENHIAYIDFDHDGIDELFVRTGAYGEHILHYDETDDTVYATFFSPRGGYVYFGNGDMAHNDEYDIPRYRIKAFNKGKAEVVEVAYREEDLSRVQLTDSIYRFDGVG